MAESSRAAVPDAEGQAILIHGFSALSDFRSATVRLARSVRHIGMRVLVVTHTLYPETTGGMQLHIRLLLGLLRAEHDVAVLTRSCDPSAPEYSVRTFEQDSVPVHSINNTFRDARDIGYLYEATGVDSAAEGVIRSVAPDVVHVHHLTCLSTGILKVCRDLGVPTVMTLHDYWMACPRGQRIHLDGGHCDVIDRKLCRSCMRGTWPGLLRSGEDDVDVEADMETIRRSDRHVAHMMDAVDQFITPSEHILRAFVARGIESDRVLVIPHGLDATPFPDVGRTDGDDDVLRIGFVGTIIPSKGVHVLLAAVDGLGGRVSLEIHGESIPYHGDTTYANHVRAIKPGGVPVRFHGRFAPEDIGRVLASIDVLVVPSTCEESFGLVVREAFLAGIPVVASRIGALTESLANDRGLLFEPGDSDDLRRQLSRMIEEPELRTRLRGKPEWVRTPDKMLADTVHAYRAAIQTRVARRSYQHVYLSPHLDDASLSCGGAIRRSVRNDESVLVVTVFAAVPVPGSPLSPLAETMHRHWGDPRDVAATREAEDRSSMAVLGADRVHLEFADCIYRGDSASQSWFYVDAGDFLGPVHRGDAHLSGQVTEIVTRVLESSPDAVVHAPLAVGNHVDHQIVHMAGVALLRLGFQVMFYEDYPYSDPGYPFVSAGSGDIEMDLDAISATRDRLSLRAKTQKFTPEDLEEKVVSICEFGSQIPALFGTADRAKSTVWSHAYRVGGAEPAERVWVPTSAVAVAR
jgi:glycosyltransferase involved in cell wall biosynthesis/LmbE family N-acetylglucosaminyl deacetylase